MEQNEMLKLLIENMRQEFKIGARAESDEAGSVTEYMVPMRDGVKLRTIVQLPKGQGPFPTLFVRSPYPFFERMNMAIGEEFIKRGYGFITQFCRGNNGSEGEWVPNENERNDGMDSINWAAEQAYVKSLGIHGTSYMALTGWIIADELPDKVKGLYLCHYSVDRYKSAYKAGLFRHDVLTGWSMPRTDKENPEDFYNRYIKASLYRPHIDVDEQLWGGRLEWYRKWISSTDASDEYWHTGVWGTLRNIPEKIKIPTCVVAGWYDHHLEGTILGYQKLNAAAKLHSKLIIGGWNHDFVPCIPAHNPKNAAMNNSINMLAWFDGLMMEEKLPEPGIEVYMIGEDKWHDLEEWPITSTDSIKLHMAMTPHESCKAFMLTSQQPNEADKAEFDYDPNHPVYSKGGETLLVSEKERGSKLQPEPGYRDDVVSFVSEAFTEDLLIAGNMNVKLYVASDCEDTSFTAKVMEVLPNGEAYNIRSSITTLAHACGVDKAYSKGEVMEINIEMLPIAWSVKQGSRLRVDISSSNFPEYAIHSNFLGAWALQEKVRIAHQTIFSGGEYASGIEIPVLRY